MNKNCSNLLILIGIIPTFSENFIQIKCGLSYTLKCNPRPFSECTKVCIILLLTVSENAFWRLSLIVRKFNLDWKVKLSTIECPVYQWQPPKCIFRLQGPCFCPIFKENHLQSRNPYPHYEVGYTCLCYFMP